MNETTQPSDRVIEPSLLDMLGDRELNEIMQKCSSSENVEIEIKISQNGQQLILAQSLKFNPCPCIPPQHNSSSGCIHRVDSSGRPIC